MSRLQSSRLFVLGSAILVAMGVARFVTANDEKQTKAEEEGARHFTEVAKVLQSPRCKNCHPAGAAPLQGDKSVRHSMNVSRLSASSGLACTTCHRNENQTQLHAPPGVANWHMPTATTPMVFEGLTVAELCSRLTDPKQNGDRTPDMLADHMDHDALVLWAWKPGPGRTPPPLTHAELMTHVNAWVKAGAPCPK